MITELQLFVREALGRGLPRAAIREKLIEAGWQPDEVAAALDAYAETDFPVPVPRRRPYLSAREAFLYLVLFVTLYVTAYNTGVLLFQFVERWLPDTARRDFGSERFAADMLRGAAAAVLIAYPIFLFLSRLIGRAIAREPEKRGSRVRKWLTYVTLFIAALVLIGDLTFLVSRLLSGELAPRFLLKVLVVFAIAGTVFGHYLADLRREEEKPGAPPRGPSPLARATGIAVVATLAIGLVLAGSPRRERQHQLDLQRVNELRLISSAIENWYRDHRALPDSLEALLRVPTSTLESVRDPVSREPYGYRGIDSVRYELCATFEAADSLGAQQYDFSRASRFWRHEAGRSCFTFEIPLSVVRAR